MRWPCMHAYVYVCLYVCVCVYTYVIGVQISLVSPDLTLLVYMGRVTYVIPGYLNARQIVRDDVIVCAGWRRLILDTDVESAFHRRT